RCASAGAQHDVPAAEGVIHGRASRYGLSTEALPRGDRRAVDGAAFANVCSPTYSRWTENEAGESDAVPTIALVDDRPRRQPLHGAGCGARDRGGLSAIELESARATLPASQLAGLREVSHRGAERDERDRLARRRHRAHEVRGRRLYWHDGRSTRRRIPLLPPRRR